MMMIDQATVRKAIMNGEVDIVWQYIDTGGDVNAVNPKGMTLLMLSIWAGKGVETTRRLLDAGSDIRPAQESSGWRAFHFAAVNDHREALELLIEHGDTFVNESDWKALHYAVQYRAYHTIPIMLRLGADIDMRDDEGKTPLMRAAKTGIVDMITMLLNHGAQKSICDPKGRTALDYAIEAGKKKAVQLLG